MRRKGFTLAELLVALVLSALVGGAAVELARTATAMAGRLHDRARAVPSSARDDATVRWVFRHAVVTSDAPVHGDADRLSFSVRCPVASERCPATIKAGALTWRGGSGSTTRRIASGKATLRYLMVVGEEYRWVDQYVSVVQLPRALEVRDGSSVRLYRMGWGDGR
jgi:prepilin-type N-terminal cleavage/methylation domain-containing protein